MVLWASGTSLKEGEALGDEMVVIGLGPQAEIVTLGAIGFLLQGSFRVTIRVLYEGP